jgi:hypothetical protein
MVLSLVQKSDELFNRTPTTFVAKQHLDKPVQKDSDTFLAGGWSPRSDGTVFVRTLSREVLQAIEQQRFTPPVGRYYRPASLKRTDGPSPNDLTRYRYHGPGISAAEEAELTGRAQSGDKRAGLRLVQAFHRFILKRAGSRNKSWFNYNNFDDLMGAATLAFWEGVSTWKSEDGCRLATNCYLRVHGAASDARKQLRKRGIAGETLLQRIAFNGGNATQAEQKRLRKRYSSFSEMAAALNEAAKQVDRWTQPVS